METIITLENILDYFKKGSFRVVASNIELSRNIFGPRNISEATGNHISFLSLKYRTTAEKLLEKSRAALIIVDTSIYEIFDEQFKKNIKSYIILSDSPKNLFIDCLHFFFKEEIISEIHPSAIIGSTVEIGNGTVVMANVVINAYSSIGNNTIINTGVIIDHDSKIGNHVHLSIGTLIGSYAVITDGISTQIGQHINSLSK